MAGDLEVAQVKKLRLWLLKNCKQYALVSQKKFPIGRGNKRISEKLADYFFTLTFKFGKTF